MLGPRASQPPKVATRQPVTRLRPTRQRTRLQVIQPADDRFGAPEAYQDFTLPEAFELAPEGKASLEEIARDLNLSQASAQRVLDLGVKHTERVQEAYANAWQEKVAQWGEQVKSDPVVGGRQYAENQQIAQAAIAKYGDAELTAMFDEYGLGNHPALVRAFYRIGKAGGESGFVAGTGNEAPVFTGSREQQLAQRMAAEQARSKQT